MAYSDFTLSRVRDDLGLTIVYKSDVFASSVAIEPSALLSEMLVEFVPLGLAINSENPDRSSSLPRFWRRFDGTSSHRFLYFPVKISVSMRKKC